MILEKSLRDASYDLRFGAENLKERGERVKS